MPGTWHLHLGQVGYDNAKGMATSGIVTGMPTDSDNCDRDCNGCDVGKESKEPCGKKSTEEITSGILDLVHSDVC